MSFLLYQFLVVLLHLGGQLPPLYQKHRVVKQLLSIYQINQSVKIYLKTMHEIILVIFSRLVDVYPPLKGH
jgi:hypothetical protein